MNIRWTERASRDALLIFDYIAEHSAAYADSVYASIVARPNQLSENPKSGSIVPEYNRPDVRELFVHSFRIFLPIDVDLLWRLTHNPRSLVVKACGGSLGTNKTQKTEPPRFCYAAMDCINRNLPDGRWKTASVKFTAGGPIGKVSPT